MQVFRVCGVRLKLYVFSLYRNPDLDDRIFDCLLTPMAAVQAEDARDSFPKGCPRKSVRERMSAKGCPRTDVRERMSVGDLDGYPQE